MVRGTCVCAWSGSAARSLGDYGDLNSGDNDKEKGEREVEKREREATSDLDLKK